ncbi:MAG: hypothetical protein GYA51_11760 [Candidatus Methanofastidiosa archaeon]|nr:hypothetical protein [Candidatus Methanofastidiosa archaeon]
MVKSKNKKRKTTKAKAWSWFSKYVRLRDCLKTTGFPDQGICVTCGRAFPFSELQAGHAIGGRNNSILFDEELVNAQCKGCNGYGNGRYADYSLWFIKRYGQKKWEEKVQLSHKLAVDLDFEEIYNRYKEKYSKLVASKK